MYDTWILLRVLHILNMPLLKINQCKESTDWHDFNKQLKSPVNNTQNLYSFVNATKLEQCDLYKAIQTRTQCTTSRTYITTDYLHIYYNLYKKHCCILRIVVHWLQTLMGLHWIKYAVSCHHSYVTKFCSEFINSILIRKHFHTTRRRMKMFSVRWYA